MKRALARIAATLGALASLGACSHGASQTAASAQPGAATMAHKTIGVSIQNREAQFYQDMESGMRADLKKTLMAKAIKGEGEVFTDPLASPTGFPFKVALVEGTSSEFPIYQERKRVCDLGYLRVAYARPDGRIGYRCASEPVIGHGQVRKDGVVEPPLVTTGDDLNTIAQFLQPGEDSYGAADVVASLLSALPLESEVDSAMLATA